MRRTLPGSTLYPYVGCVIAIDTPFVGVGVGAGAVTVKPIVAVLMRVPEVPVTVTV